jgi:hypothetical protein
MIPAVIAFAVAFSLMAKDQAMKLTPIEYCNQLTKQACMSYHRVASLLLAIGFSSQLNHALQGGFFSIPDLIITSF